MNEALLGVVLCGGRSSRMGSDKALLRHPSGGSFVQRAIERLQPICDQVCLAGGPVHELGVPVIPDPIQYRGPATGVGQALDFAAQQGYSACLVTPVDMPYLTESDLMDLRKAWITQPRVCCAVCPTNDRVQPLVAVYPTSLRDTIQQLAESENRSLSRWIQGQPITRVPLSAKSCLNINTPEDLSSGSEVSV